jgi:sarcosine oxidase subunit beta
MTSVIIIGGGVAGFSAASACAERGLKTTLVERRHLASGSSGLSAGVFSINQTDPLMLDIRVKSRLWIDRLEREAGLHVARIGYMRLARKPEHLELFRTAIDLQQPYDVKPSVLLDREQVAELVPDLELADVVGAMHNFEDGHIDGPILCGILNERARSFGAEMRFGVEVKDVSRTTSGRFSLRLDGDESIESDFVVNAAGPWAEAVGEMLGAPLEIVNERHEVILMKPPTQLAYTVPMVQEYVSGEPEGVYFRQDSPNQIIGGLHSHQLFGDGESVDPDSYDRSISWEAVEEAAIKLSKRLKIDDLGFESGWTGLYPLSADAQYVVGPYEHDPKLLVIGGLSGSGVGSSLSLGRLVADWIDLGEPREIVGAEALLPDRPSLRRGSRGARS